MCLDGDGQRLRSKLYIAKCYLYYNPVYTRPNCSTCIVHCFVPNSSILITVYITITGYIFINYYRDTTVWQMKKGARNYKCVVHHYHGYTG